MEIARLRALTRATREHGAETEVWVEMRFARLRALTRYPKVRFGLRMLRRNENRPIEGIDTVSQSSIRIAHAS